MTLGELAICMNIIVAAIVIGRAIDRPRETLEKGQKP